MSEPNKYLRVCPINEDPADFLAEAELAHQYPYPLDPFQKHAIAAIHRGENVFVTAKTGSGKTLVGEYQIYHSLSRNKRERTDNSLMEVSTGGRVFYTTPIKSLSNQKFNDLSKLFPSVGIMTGDIKYRPDAQVVIMTTEILRNLLYKRGTATEKLGLTADLSLDGLDAVIFDEVHYINNAERGKVWEETMILLPPEVRLILLSATLAQPEIFGGWLGRLKEVPVNLISTQYRVVPLTHSLVSFTGDKPILKTLMDSKENYTDKVYIDWLKEQRQLDKDTDKFREAVRAKNATDRANALNEDHVKAPVEWHADGVTSSKPRQVAHIYRINALVEHMRDQGLLPCLMFIFSRKKCEEYAAKLDVELLTWCESSEVAAIFKSHLSTRADIRALAQTRELQELAVKGIAYHHSGLIPVLKEIIEILFSKGLIKVMFCTETFAVGINMPTKTVVFLGYTKYSDERDCSRVLYTDEYMQMAGRAGRRGLDKVGHVLHLPPTGTRDLITADEMRKMMKGGMPTVTSRMDFSYEFILKTLNAGGGLWSRVIKNSYWAEQQRAGTLTLEKDIATAKMKMGALGIDALLMQLREGWVLQEAATEGKEARQAFDRWRQKRIGPVWDSAWKKMKEYVEAEKLIARRQAEIEELYQRLDAPEGMLEGRMRVLYDLGYVKEDAESMDPILTRKGLMASEVNEGSPILMVELYESGLLKGLGWREVVAELAGFLGDKWNIGDTTSAIALRDTLKNIQVTEKNHGVITADSAWVYDETHVNIFTDYLENGGEQDLDQADEQTQEEQNGLDQVCAKYDMYAGDFMKALTKIDNLVEEWRTICTIAEDVDGLQTMMEFRRFVEADSIYLREAAKGC
jgi:superfamily II RNA helicase